MKTKSVWFLVISALKLKPEASRSNREDTLQHILPLDENNNMVSYHLCTYPSSIPKKEEDRREKKEREIRFLTKEMGLGLKFKLCNIYISNLFVYLFHFQVDKPFSYRKKRKKKKKKRQAF